MMLGVATGIGGYLAGFTLSFGLLSAACGGRGPQCPKARDGVDSRPAPTCEVRR